ncbi:MAG: redoxin domain-containing protein [Planctomycetota bacterium]
MTFPVFVRATSASLLLVLAGQVASAQSPVSPPEVMPVLLQMIRDDAIHSELNLTADQRATILEWLKPIDGPWLRSRYQKEDERREVIRKATEWLDGKLQTVLNADQRERLEQLRNQALGTRMVVRDRTASDLGLTSTQREELYQEFLASDATAAEVNSQLRGGKIDPAEAAKKLAALKKKEQDVFSDTLTNEQLRKLSGETGSAFDFSQVKRMYPRAPELTMDGSQWLQSSGVKLEDLRGKVVAVHFYAFQCINCVRNLPHYNGWHEDYADKGLVVIGIQTPETRAERSRERVSAAIPEQGIEYPVLFDEQSQNWKTWNNQMWPAVYLIDKDGFIRRWWEGEMNWKGAEGEKDMRNTIEQLLAE